MNILLISYNWLPSNNVGVKRAVKFAKYLSLKGHKVYILTSQDNPQHLEDTKDIKLYKISDPQYLIKLINNIKHIIKKEKYKNTKESLKTNNLKNKEPKPNSVIRDLIFFPDEYFSWFFNAIKIGSKIIKKYDIDIIISTSPPITAHFINTYLSKKFKIKNILDIRDPWAFYHQALKSKYYFIIKYLRFIFEKLLLKDSTFITIISYKLKKFYIEKFKKNKIFTIYNCFQKTNAKKTIFSEDNILTFIYTGKIHKKNQNPENLFIVLYELKKENKINPKNLKFIFYTFGYYGPNLEKLALKYNIQDIIEIKGMIPYKKALNEIQKSHICIIFDWISKTDPIGKGVIPVKFYDYLSYYKPILLVNAQKDGNLCNILKKTGLGFISYNKNQLKNNILTLYNTFLSKKKIDITPNHNFINKFSCEYQISYKLNKIITKLE